MDESPKPTDAMLHGDPAVLRSLIMPSVGLASFQKKLKAACWMLSRISPSESWARAGAARQSVASKTQNVFDPTLRMDAFPSRPPGAVGVSTRSVAPP